MKKTILSGIAAAAITLSMGAQASSFNYIDYAIGTMDYDTNGVDDGDYSSLSASFETSLVPFMLVESTDYDGYEEFTIGAGAYSEIGSSANFYGIVHYVSKDGDDDDDIRLTGGIRGLITDSLELDVKFRNDITDDDADTVSKFSLGYYFTDSVSLAGNYEVFDNLDILSISGRFSF